MPQTVLRAILCDIDGCLVPETSAPLPVEALTRLAVHNRQALAQRDRPMITLCSGRPAPFVEAMARMLSVAGVPAIGENGVWLWFPEDGRFEADPSISQAHRQQVADASRWATEVLEPRGFMLQPGKRYSMSLYHADEGQLVAALAELPEVFAQRGWPLRVSRTWHWINCDLTQVSKATGARRLMQATGRQRPQLAGIGDTLGDLGIREQVGWFACPANAVAGLKQQADYVAKEPVLDGVFDILARLEAQGWSVDA